MDKHYQYRKPSTNHCHYCGKVLKDSGKKEAMCFMVFGDLYMVCGPGECFEKWKKKFKDDTYLLDYVGSVQRVRRLLSTF